MADFLNYDPAEILVVFNGVELFGFAEGTFISVERSNDSFQKKIGAGGDQTRTRLRDRSGTITITLLAESISNDDLSELWLDDERNGSGSGEFFLKNRNGSTICHAANAWVMKPPTVEYGVESSNREWTLECGELEIYVGGADV